MGDAPYRGPVGPLPDPYAAGWARIRRARNVATASVLGILGCAALMVLAADLRSVLGAVLLEVGVAVFIVLGLAQGYDARCPHCDAQFFGARLALFARRCPSCQTPFGARAHADRPASSLRCR
jgi:hypothetical protein